eukprot:9185153-Lingulodinium_polyedra.AAC.1
MESLGNTARYTCPLVAAMRMICASTLRFELWSTLQACLCFAPICMRCARQHASVLALWLERVRMFSG